MGSFNHRTDFCPVALKENSINCSDPASMPLFFHPNEFYGEGSRCFDSASDAQPLCLSSKCNSENQRLEVYVGNRTFICDLFEKEIQLPDGGSFLCPKLTSVCPE